MLYKSYLGLQIQPLLLKKFSSHNNSANSCQVSVLCSVLNHTQGLQMKRHSGLQKHPPAPPIWVRSLPCGPQDNGRFSNGSSGEQREKRMHLSPQRHSSRFQGISVFHNRPFCFQSSISVYIKTYMRDWGLRLHRKCMNIYFPSNTINRKVKWDNAGRYAWHAVSWTTKGWNHNLPVWTSKT